MGSMNALPLDIALDIFSRLDVDSVLESKLVCKPWRNLIRNPSFAGMHLARRKLLLQYLDNGSIQDFSTTEYESIQSGFLLSENINYKTSLMGFNKSVDCRLCYVEYNVNTKKKSYEVKTKTINIPPIKQTEFDCKRFMGSSCNGLICATMHHHQLNDPIHIFNPVTREYVYLPRYSKFDACDMMSGFGYSLSTDEYKVVRIYHKGNACYFQVYILGNESNKWTEEREIPNLRLHNVDRTGGVLVNGEIHWLDEASKIVAFSLADEEFQYIALPPSVGGCAYPDRTEFSVLGNRLCLVHHRFSTTERAMERTDVDIWLLNNNNDISVQQNGNCNWDKECTVQVETRISLIPLAFTKKGNILFWQDYGFVSSYDPTTAILEKLSKDGNYGKADLGFFQAVRHINSFVSLKALGVKNCKRRLQYMSK